MATSLRTDGSVAYAVNSYDDLEDSIHELSDELWKAADAVQSNEPLAAKQFLEDAQYKWNALSQFISNLKDSTDDADTVRSSSGDSSVRGDGQEQQAGKLSPAARARHLGKNR